MKQLKLQDIFNADLNGIYEHDFVLIVICNELKLCKKEDIKKLEKHIQCWAPMPMMIVCKE